jgi:hypothetical protein
MVRMIMVSSVAVVAALWAAACTPGTEPRASEDAGRPAEPRRPTEPTPPPDSGVSMQIPLTLVADGAATPGSGDGAMPGPDEIVSLGVPFAPGVLGAPHAPYTPYSIDSVRVLDANGREVPTDVRPLAVWPTDSSLRSVLVAFRATVARGETAQWSIEYGGAPGQRAGELRARPDGPVVAILPPDWYEQAGVLGPQVAAAHNHMFADWESEIEYALERMAPPWRSYGQSCERTPHERTYYDAPHALFQRFVRHGTAESYRRAREEASWYRQNELDWYDDDEVALYSCAEEWDPTQPIAWSVLRNMLAQGMLDDYLLTGDPEAARALRGLGEAYLRNLPALAAGPEVTLTITERNLAWPMMGLASYYALEPRPELAAALDQLVTTAVDWQSAGTSGAFEHDLVRPDPDECGQGPRGGSPFMTSLLIDGLMETWSLTGDERIPPVVLRAAAWLRDYAFDPAHTAFVYLWGCEDRNYREEDWSSLNLLIVHVFGAAHHLSHDEAWLDFGDRVARRGIESMYAYTPKQWSQSARSFSQYMGHRARAREP